MFTGTVNIVILFDVCVPFGSVYNKVKLVAYVSINIVYSVHCKSSAAWIDNALFWSSQAALSPLCPGTASRLLRLCMRHAHIEGDRVGEEGGIPTGMTGSDHLASHWTRVYKFPILQTSMVAKDHGAQPLTAGVSG